MRLIPSARNRQVILVCVLVGAVAIGIGITVKFHRFNNRFLAIRIGEDYSVERYKLLAEYPGMAVKGKEGDSGILVIQIGNWLVSKTICIYASKRGIDAKGSATDVFYFIEYQQFENDGRGLVTHFNWR